jgi:TPR repeat protein
MPSHSFLRRIVLYSATFATIARILPAQTQPGDPNTSHKVASVQAEHAANLAAAQQGVVAAQLNLAKSYNQGVLVDGTSVLKRNHAKALQWFQAAFQQGSVEAGAWIGSMYVLGHGVPQDVSRGAEMILASANHDDPVGLLLAGVIYENGQGVKRSYTKAFDYYSQALAKGEVRALDRLGSLYLEGHGTDRSLPKAFALFKRGAALRDAGAELHLAAIYYSGHIPEDSSLFGGTNQGVDSALGLSQTRKAHHPPVPDYVTAANLYSQAAGQGNRVAAFRLGRMYETGKGVKQDYSRAFEYYRQSAHRGFAPALVALGQAHEIGRGTEVNLLHAYVAYKLAIVHKDEAAEQLLEAVTKKMSPAQIEQAEGLLQDYKKRTAELDEGD